MNEKLMKLYVTLQSAMLELHGILQSRNIKYCNQIITYKNFQEIGIRTNHNGVDMICNPTSANIIDGDEQGIYVEFDIDKIEYNDQLYLERLFEDFTIELQGNDFEMIMPNNQWKRRLARFKQIDGIEGDVKVFEHIINAAIDIIISDTEEALELEKNAIKEYELHESKQTYWM